MTAAATASPTHRPRRRAAGTGAARRDPRKAEFEANKLAKRLRRQVGEAIADYDMIAAATA